jgi:hypothetical protein
VLGLKNLVELTLHTWGTTGSCNSQQRQTRNGTRGGGERGGYWNQAAIYMVVYFIPQMSVVVWSWFLEFEVKSKPTKCTTRMWCWQEVSRSRLCLFKSVSFECVCVAEKRRVGDCAESMQATLKPHPHSI